MEQDRRAIQGFLSFVQELLDEIVHHRPDIIPREGLYPSFEMAWPPVMAALNRAREELVSNRLDEPLDRVGLTGFSLGLKLAGVESACVGVREAGAAVARYASSLIG